MKKSRWLLGLWLLIGLGATRTALAQATDHEVLASHAVPLIRDIPRSPSVAFDAACGRFVADFDGALVWHIALDADHQPLEMRLVA